MGESRATEDMLTLDEAEQEYGVKRSTLYRYVQKGELHTYRRGMDRRAYVRRSDVERVRGFHRPAQQRGPTLAAVDRAWAFQRRVFGDQLPRSGASRPGGDANREPDQVPS